MRASGAWRRNGWRRRGLAVLAVVLAGALVPMAARADEAALLGAAVLLIAMGGWLVTRGRRYTVAGRRR